MTDKIFYSPITTEPLHRVPDDATIPADTPHGFETPIGHFIWVVVPVSAYPPEGRMGGYTYWTEEPIAPPMPPLPTKPGSLVRATSHEGDTCEVMVLSADEIWWGVDQDTDLRSWISEDIASWEPVRVLPNGVGAMDETNKRDVEGRDGYKWWWSEFGGVWRGAGGSVRGSKAHIARDLGPLRVAEGADA